MFKTILLVSIPTIFISLMTALFIFCDQLMVINLVPIYNTNYDLFGKDLYASYNAILVLHWDLGLSTINVESVVRSAISYTSVVTTIITATALLIANGTNILFTRQSAKKQLVNANETLRTGFYTVLISSLLLMILIASLTQVITSIQGGDIEAAIKNATASPELSDLEIRTITDMYQRNYDLINHYSSMYIYIICGTVLFNMVNQLMSLVLVSEGKKGSILLFYISCNGLNITLDFIFIAFTSLSMLSGAVALLIGSVLNSVALFSYIFYLYKKKQTIIDISYIAKIKMNLNHFLNIFKAGAASFLRNLSMALVAILQMSMLAFVTTNIGSSAPNTYQSIYGAVTPIYNLLFSVSLGIIQGTRVVCAYNFGAGNLKRVKDSFWVCTIYGVIIGVFMTIFGGIALSNVLLSGAFHIDPSIMSEAGFILLISLAQMPTFAFSIGGMMLMQSSHRWKSASVIGMMQSIIYIPVCIILTLASVKTANIYPFLWSAFSSMIIASTIIFTWSVIYIKRKLPLDIDKATNVSLHLKKKINTKTADSTTL